MTVHFENIFIFLNLKINTKETKFSKNNILVILSINSFKQVYI